MEERPHNNASGISFFDGFRATFYLLTPAESSFEKMSQVPNYVNSATNHFFNMIMLELLVLYFKGRELRLNDKVTCVGAGLYSEILGLMGLKTIQWSMYAKVYEHYCLYQLPWDSVWTWIFMALLYDMLYYWFHRAAHEVSFLWNTHQTHHSSEDYTLSTALRQSAFQTYASAFFYLPAALLVPPSVFLVHAQLNLIYQFWIHTELVDSLGPLEYILNTPSHHRVHHGRNPYCIDKNYAAVLIIWDRMFGTFQPEKKDEKVVYGLVHNVNTFDSNSIQVSHYVDYFKRFWQSKGIVNKIKFFFYGPGWSPGTPRLGNPEDLPKDGVLVPQDLAIQRIYQSMCREKHFFGNKIKFVFYGPGWSPGTPRLGNPEDLPKIEHPVKKYNPEVSSWLNAYVFFHFLLAVGIYEMAMLNHLTLPRLGVLSASAFCIASFTCFGYLFDKRSFASAAEFLRCAISTSVLLRFRPAISQHLSVEENTLLAILAAFMISAAIWPLVGVGVGMKTTKEKAA